MYVHALYIKTTSMFSSPTTHSSPHFLFYPQNKKLLFIHHVISSTLYLLWPYHQRKRKWCEQQRITCKGAKSESFGKHAALEKYRCTSTAQKTFGSKRSDSPSPVVTTPSLLRLNHRMTQAAASPCTSCEGDVPRFGDFSMWKKPGGGGTTFIFLVFFAWISILFYRGLMF